MDAASLYRYLEEEFQGALVRSARQDGVAFFWQDRLTQPSTRLVRIKESADGTVVEIKLAQSSLGGKAVVLPLPATSEQVAHAVRTELHLLTRDGVPIAGDADLV